MRPQRRKNVRMLRRRRLPHGWQMEVVILDSADVEHQGARELRHIGVARRLHDHFVEPLVARHHRRRVVLFACRLRVAQRALKLKKVLLRQLSARQLRRKRLQLGKRLVALLDVHRVERRNHGCPARHHQHQLLALQLLQRLAHWRAADMEILAQLGIENFFSRFENTRDNPVANFLIHRLTGGFSVDDPASLWDRHGAPFFPVHFRIYLCYHSLLLFATGHFVKLIQKKRPKSCKRKNF